MQKAAAFLMFVGDQFGKAEEAMNLYVSLFDNSAITHIERWKADEPGGRDGLIKQAIFTIDGQEFMASENAMDHQFNFTPAFSIYINCSNNGELESLFASLSEDGFVMMPLDNYGFSTRFGWTSDKFGVSWQLNLA